MGCISSKHVVRASLVSSPVLPNNINPNDSAMSLKNKSVQLDLDSNSSSNRKKDGERSVENRSRELKKSKKETSHSRGSFSFRLGFSHRYVQAEQTSAGWPTWLSNVAAEAINGWVPLRADSFEKLEKVGLNQF